MEEQRQHGNHHHTAAQPGQRPQKPGQQRAQSDKSGKFENVHAVVPDPRRIGRALPAKV